MAGRAALDEFVVARSDCCCARPISAHPRPRLAEDLLQTALTKAWLAWHRIGGDPETYVRRILATTFATWWRRRWRAEPPNADHGPHTP